MGHNSNCKWLLLVEYKFFFIAESPNFSDSFIEVDIFWKQIYLFWRFGIWRLLRRKLFLAIIGVACLVSRCTISICKYRSPATKTKWTHLPVLMKACLTDTILLTNYYLRWLFLAIYLGWTGLGRLIFAKILSTPGFFITTIWQILVRGEKYSW